MKNNTSPGSNGISVEFYKLFAKDIKKFYMNSIIYSYTTGSYVTELQTQSIITHILVKH